MFWKRLIDQRLIQFSFGGHEPYQEAETGFKGMLHFLWVIVSNQIIKGVHGHTDLKAEQYKNAVSKTGKVAKIMEETVWPSHIQINFI